MDAVAAGDRAHAFHGLLAPLAYDVRRPERLRELDPVRTTAQDEDPLGAEAAGREDPAQADGSVAHDGHRPAGTDPGGASCMVARPHHVRQRE